LYTIRRSTGSQWSSLRVFVEIETRSNLRNFKTSRTAAFKTRLHIREPKMSSLDAFSEPEADLDSILAYPTPTPRPRLRGSRPRPRPRLVKTQVTRTPSLAWSESQYVCDRGSAADPARGAAVTALLQTTCWI